MLRPTWQDSPTNPRHPQNPHGGRTGRRRWSLPGAVPAQPKASLRVTGAAGGGPECTRASEASLLSSGGVLDHEVELRRSAGRVIRPALEALTRLTDPRTDPSMPSCVPGELGIFQKMSQDEPPVCSWIPSRSKRETSHEFELKSPVSKKGTPPLSDEKELQRRFGPTLLYIPFIVYPIVDV